GCPSSLLTCSGQACHSPLHHLEPERPQPFLELRVGHASGSGARAHARLGRGTFSGCAAGQGQQQGFIGVFPATVSHGTPPFGIISLEVWPITRPIQRGSARLSCP